MEYFPIILLLLSCLLFVSRPFTILFHELGHAIPAVLLTKEKVTIYIGSYGDSKESLNINIGLLEIWIKYNPLLWRVGLCVPSAKNISINRRIVFILMGPIASFMVAVAVCCLSFVFNFHISIQLILVVFLGSAISDLCINLIPKSTPIQLPDGRLTYNDGYWVKQLFYSKKFPNEYTETVELKYAEALNKKTHDFLS